MARFIVDVIAQLDVSPIYARYGERGGEPLAPEILLGLLFYGYATGVFSSRKIEKATFESIPFRFVAGGLHPDHDTLANFRKTFLPELHEMNWPSATSGWKIWRRLKPYWTLRAEPGNAMRRNKPPTKLKCVSGKKKPRKRSTSPGVANPNHPSRDHGTKINITSRIPTRAS